MSAAATEEVGSGERREAAGPPAAASQNPALHPAASLFELALAEFRLNARSAGFRVLGVVLLLFAMIALTGTRFAEPLILRSGPIAAQVVGMALQGLLLTLAPLLVCGAARREYRLGMEELLLSKPPSSEAILWGKFLGAFASLLVLIFASTAAVILAELVLFRGLPAVRMPLIFGLRSVFPILFIAGLSFALATFLRSAMVAGLIIALTIGIAAGRTYLVPALQLSLTQYQPAYGLLGLALVAAIAGWWERRREPEKRYPASWIAGLALLAASLDTGVVAAREWRGWTLDEDPALARLAGWKEKGALPSPLLRTVAGGSVRLSSWQGKPVVLVFWSTDSPESVSEAAALERGWRAAAPDRIGFASVCLTDDPVQAADLARDAGLRAPVIWNPPSRFGESTGLAALFNVADNLHAAVAGLIRRDGTLTRPAAAVSQPPPNPRGRPPHREWERRLVELGTTAFRQLAEGSR